MIPSRIPLDPRADDADRAGIRRMRAKNLGGTPTVTPVPTRPPLSDAERAQRQLEGIGNVAEAQDMRGNRRVLTLG